MARYSRNTVILAKIETTPGTDATPVGATDAILVSNQTINPLNATNVDRAVLRGYFGGSEQLVASAYVEVSFDIEIAGSGAAGTAPAWGPLLRGCAFAEVVTAAARVDYTPISTALESLTIYYYDDGALHKLLMARGDFSIKMDSGGKPVFTMKFLGMDGGLTAVSNAVPTLTGWKTPLTVTDTNTADITFGGTYATGAITGGTNYPSKGLDLAMNNKVAHIPLLGGDSIGITDRAVSGTCELDLTAANEVTFMATVKSNSTQSMSILHGTAAGNKVLLFAPAVQLINPKKTDLSGRRLIGYDLRLIPSAGNDELRIVAL